jgi:hypothetical protein
MQTPTHQEADTAATGPESGPEAIDPCPTRFSLPDGLLVLSPNASADDVHTRLDTSLSHLYAMLSMTYGPGYQAFKGYNETIQENYLWACSSLASECQVMLEALHDLHRDEVRLAGASALAASTAGAYGA